MSMRLRYYTYLKLWMNILYIYLSLIINDYFMFKGNQEIRRVPVRYRNKPLMPTTWRKALNLMKLKKAILVKDKVLGVYLKLKYKPKTTYTQGMSLGIDPGSMFDGYSIISEDEDNHRNFQFNHQLAIDKKLKGLMNKRIGYRRLRRNRIRHRPIRIESRNGNKISNTSNYYLQNRVNMIKRIISLYPIKLISIEDIRYNHYKSNLGKSFSNIEIGKNRLYDYITKTLNLRLYKVKGKQSKDLREIIFPNRIKNRDKSIRNFNSHCIDSFVIGVLGLCETIPDSYRFIISLFDMNQLNKLNTLVRFIDRVPYKVRRELYQHKCNYKDKKYYFRYRKGGTKVIFRHFSKLKKVRSKLNDTKSNHGKIWRYFYTIPEETYKKGVFRNGGTVIFNKRRNLDLKVSKYWNGDHYIYYTSKSMQ